MYAVTYRAKPYQFALLIKKSIDDVILIGTQQSACEATTIIPVLKYSFLPYLCFICRNSIDTFQEMCILHKYINLIKIAFACLLALGSDKLPVGLK